MAYEHKPGTFSLFKNDKGDNPKRPDYTGEGVDIDGKPIKVSAWLKEGKNGKFMSCTLQHKTRGEAPVASAKTARDLSDMDSDIPFAPIGRGISGHAI
jgi:hypothetical protein